MKNLTIQSVLVILCVFIFSSIDYLLAVDKEKSFNVQKGDLLDVKIEQGMSPLEAGFKGSNVIFFAIIATTITLVAVFFPIVFLQGMTGRLFREFSIVIAGAVAISAFVALTFTPMLATKMLKTRHNRSKAYLASEKIFIRINQAYQNTLENFLKRRIDRKILHGKGTQCRGQI